MLKSAQGPFRVLPEYSIFAPGIEAEAVQVALNLSNVIAPKGRYAQVEETIPESEGSLHKLVPGCLIDTPIRPQSPLLLESTDYSGCLLPVVGLPGLRLKALARIPKIAQPFLDIADGETPVTRLYRFQPLALLA